MSTQVNSMPVARIIEKNHQAFLSDPEYQTSIKNLDKAKLNEGTKGLKEDIAEMVNYYVYQRQLVSMKLIHGNVSDTALKNLVARGKAFMDIYGKVDTSLSTIEGAATSCGLGKVIEKHIVPVCAHLDHNPRVLAVVNEYEQMGITKSEISCVTEELRQQNFNLLRYAGSDGTFSGFMHRLGAMKPDVEKELKLIEEHGIPAVRGAGGSPSTGEKTAVGVGAVVVAAVLCIFFY